MVIFNMNHHSVGLKCCSVKSPVRLHRALHSSFLHLLLLCNSLKFVQVNTEFKVSVLTCYCLQKTNLYLDSAFVSSCATVTDTIVAASQSLLFSPCCASCSIIIIILLLSMTEQHASVNIYLPYPGLQSGQRAAQTRSTCASRPSHLLRASHWKHVLPLLLWAARCKRGTRWWICSLTSFLWRCFCRKHMSKSPVPRRQVVLHWKRLKVLLIFW